MPFATVYPKNLIDFFFVQEIDNPIVDMLEKQAEEK